MKANEAPEKIYFDGESKACKLPIFSSCNIEYTRTDAFIEKAGDYLQKNLWRIVLEEGEFIQRFVTDFRNYMEGE